jgi:hypothetical protein
VGRLESLFEREWEEEIVSKDWLSAVVITLHRKGDKMNFRGINLMDIVCVYQSYIFAHTVLKRFQKYQ